MTALMAAADWRVIVLPFVLTALFLPFLLLVAWWRRRDPKANAEFERLREQLDETERLIGAALRPPLERACHALSRWLERSKP